MNRISEHLRILLKPRRFNGADTVRLVLLSLAALLLVLFLVTAMFDKRRTIVIEAQTTSADIVFVGGSNDWSLPVATICYLRAQPDIAGDAGEDQCDARFFKVETHENLTLRWNEGTKITTRLSDDGALSLIVENDRMPDLPEGSIILATPDAWRDAGALTFSAKITAGTLIGSGERHFLSSGRWEAREAGMATSFLRSNVTEVIKQGELVRGSTVSVWSDQRRSQMFGYLTAGASIDRPHLELVALSASGDVELRIGYFGASQPAVIRPDLIDVAISSPLLLAMAVVLSVLASVTQILGDLVSRLRAPDSRSNKQ